MTEIDKQDCMYPDCLIRGNWMGSACEHSCPHEQWMKDNWEPKETGDAWTGGFAKNH